MYKIYILTWPRALKITELIKILNEKFTCYFYKLPSALTNNRGCVCTFLTSANYTRFFWLYSCAFIFSSSILQCFLLWCSSFPRASPLYYNGPNVWIFLLLFTITSTFSHLLACFKNNYFQCTQKYALRKFF